MGHRTQSVRPDWAKFRHFFEGLCGKFSNTLFQILYAIGQILFVLNGQILKTNLAKWSHWTQLTNTQSVMGQIGHQNTQRHIGILGYSQSGQRHAYERLRDR